MVKTFLDKMINPERLGIYRITVLRVFLHYMIIAVDCFVLYFPVNGLHRILQIPVKTP